MLLLTIFEFAAVVLVIIGLFNEDKLIALEEKWGSALGAFIGKKLRRLYIKKKGK